MAQAGSDILFENIFDGLEKFGFEVLADKSIDIFETKTKKPAAAEEGAEKVFDINDYVYAKKFNCPVCLENFESFVVRSSKTKLEGVEFDLRPIHSPINHLFYDVLCCPSCGYTAVTKAFDKITTRQAELVLVELKPLYKHQPYPIEPAIDEVIDRYKLALLNATIRKAKHGEKAYICMKLTWLYRIKGDDLENEEKFATLTIRGFMQALENEVTPIMGIEEVTLLYVIAAFSKFMGNYKNALKILSTIITSRKTSERLKERSRDLRDEINAQISLDKNA
ncbi:MAG: DUF2225 domain-containing protein [Defluviitaleaceae bacterium]|nr:DUF2225 domain-containing protein [Defluviitaleaceae bacterium]